MSDHMKDPFDCIVAPASAAGRSAVAVIRLSGAGSHDIVCRLAGKSRAVAPDSRESAELDVPVAEWSDRRMNLAWLRDPETGRVLDQAMFVLYRAGASFTGEESGEIFCHGGPVIVGSVVRACVALGARHAGPGDFTKRAVANGRLDMVQAEAVALLTESENETAADVALDALAGKSSALLASMSESLLDILADCEAALDFDAEDDVYVDLGDLPGRLEDAVSIMDRWISESRAVRPALSGFRVVVCGLPNAGKSTLFNAIAGADVAIVHDEPGTTRDVVTERIVLGGMACVLSDTAGIRAAPGAVEAEGVRRALKAASEADLLLLAVDSSTCDALQSARDQSAILSTRPDAIVLTKADLSAGLNGDPSGFGCPVFVVSAVNGSGLAGLLAFVSEAAASAVRLIRGRSAVVAGERQTESLSRAASLLTEALRINADGAPLEAVAGCVRESVEALGEITGARLTDEVLGRIFARFCVGK